MLTGASLAQDRGRMEARIEALTAEVSGLKKECQVNIFNGVRNRPHTTHYTLYFISCRSFRSS